MRSVLELFDSRVSYLEQLHGVVTVYFSHAFIHKSNGKPGRDPGTSWSQEAQLTILNANELGPVSTLPNTVSEGFLEVGGIKHEFIPLPFKRKVPANLWFQFIDGSLIEIAGEKPIIELLGKPIFLEKY